MDNKVLPTKEYIEFINTFLEGMKNGSHFSYSNIVKFEKAISRTIANIKNTRSINEDDLSFFQYIEKEISTMRNEASIYLSFVESKITIIGNLTKKIENGDCNEEYFKTIDEEIHSLKERTKESAKQSELQAKLIKTVGDFLLKLQNNQEVPEA